MKCSQTLCYKAAPYNLQSVLYTGFRPSKIYLIFFHADDSNLENYCLNLHSRKRRSLKNLGHSLKVFFEVQQVVTVHKHYGGCSSVG